MKYKIITLILFLLPMANSFSQFRIPAFDVSVKGGISFIPELEADNVKYYYSAPIVAGEVNFHIGQRIAVGAFWTKAIGGRVLVDLNIGSEIGEYDASHQQYGATIRLATGRKPRVRPYFQLSFYKSEMYIDYGSYRIANNTHGLGFSLGLMIKLSDKLYLNIPEIGLRTVADKFFFSSNTGFISNAMVEFKGGLTYNFSKRK